MRRRGDPAYERGGSLRDDIGALQRAMEKNAVVLADGTDADVIALAEDPLEVAVQIFYVRGGRVRGQRGWVADKVDDAETGDPRRAVPHPALRRRGRRRGAQGGSRTRPARRRRRAHDLAERAQGQPGVATGAAAR
jgi:hypothetical protein